MIQAWDLGNGFGGVLAMRRGKKSESEGITKVGK